MQFDIERQSYLSDFTERPNDCLLQGQRGGHLPQAFSIAKKLLSDKFHSLKNWWEEDERNQIIRECIALGFDDLAKELRKDLNPKSEDL